MKQYTHRIVRLLAVLLLSIYILTGCTNKPFLTPENSYAILTMMPDGKFHSTPIKLPWNANTAVLQKLLGEASFVLSDLHTPTLQAQDSSQATTYLLSTFPENKKLVLNVDGLSLNMDVQSIQIEVLGGEIGRVVLNQTWILQGIPDPNLTPAYLDFVNMLQDHFKIECEPVMFKGHKIR
ncbi:MAG: hypothetical protein ACYCVD_01740 [Desulfitobacteriaceae bacterium]